MRNRPHRGGSCDSRPGCGADDRPLNGEAGDAVVTQALVDNPGECFAHVFNLTEAFYIFFRWGGSDASDAAIQTRLDAGVVAHEDADTAFWKDAGTFKGTHAMSLPDAFCLALARRLGGVAVTTDHAEFGPLVPFGYCPILFIRYCSSRLRRRGTIGQKGTPP